MPCISSQSTVLEAVWQGYVLDTYSSRPVEFEVPDAMKMSFRVKHYGKKAKGTESVKQGASHSAKPLKYYYAVGLLILGALLLRLAIAWISARFVYALPMLGGLLQSLELMEATNVVVFAILGVGLGAFTQWLPRRKSLVVKVIPLLLAVPLVFFTGYSVRHHLWVQQVAVESELLPAQARQVTDRLLVQATGTGGFMGFFQYTVQVPVLPTDLSALENIDEDDKWFRSELTRFSGLQPGVFTRLFRWTGWGLRLFYIVLTVVTAAIYFTKGLLWATNRRKT